MAKGITVVENPEWEKIEDGSYIVNGIQEFISFGPDGVTPIFEDSFNKLKVKVKLRTTTGTEGPAMSLTAPEFIALVRAFGGETFAPKYEDRTLSKTLLEGQTAANAGGKQFSVKAKGGWCNYSNEVNLPVGGYTVKYVGAHRTDRADSLEFFMSEGGEYGPNEYLWFDFVVVSDAMGNPTVWKDYPISIPMTKVFVERKELNGEIYDAVADGRPVWVDGVNKMRWEYFIQYFAPDIFEYEWAVKPEQSQDQVCEVTEPQYPIHREALKAQRLVKVYWQKKEKGKGYWFNMQDLPKLNLGDVASEETEEVRTATTADFVAFVKPRAWVTDELEPYGNIFETENPIAFTEEGKAWALQHVCNKEGTIGPWIDAGLDPNNRRFDALSPEQFGLLMQEMENQYK